LAPSRQNTRSELFVEALHSQGVIHEKIFSMIFGKDNEESKIIFGGYNPAYAKQGHFLTWNPLISKNYWTVRLVGVSMGFDEVPIKSTSAILDSGTSYVLMPDEDFQKFQPHLSKGKDCSWDFGKSNLYSCDCVGRQKSDFPAVRIKIGENVYAIPPESYVQIVTLEDSAFARASTKCYFKLLSQKFKHSHGFWILGDVFLHNYYTVFDLEREQIGLVGAVHVEKISFWYDILYLALILACSFVLMLVSIGVYRDYRTKKS